MKARTKSKGKRIILTHTCQMHFSKATAIAIVAALPLALSSPVLSTRQNGVTCQTSSASPGTDDVTAVINDLKDRGGNCPNTNGHASGNFFLQSHQS